MPPQPPGPQVLIGTAGVTEESTEGIAPQDRPKALGGATQNALMGTARPQKWPTNLGQLMMWAMIPSHSPQFEQPQRNRLEAARKGGGEKNAGYKGVPPHGEPGMPRPNQVSQFHNSRAYRKAPSTEERDSLMIRNSTLHLMRESGDETPKHHRIRFPRPFEVRRKRERKKKERKKSHRGEYRGWRRGVKGPEALARSRGPWLSQRWNRKPLYAFTREPRRWKELQKERRKGRRRGDGEKEMRLRPPHRSWRGCNARWFKERVVKPEDEPRKEKEAQISQAERIKAATWNCTGILESGKLHTVIEVTRRRKVDVMVLTETHTKECDRYMIKGYTVMHSADEERDVAGKLKQNFTGVALIAAPRITPTLVDFRPRGERMFTATFNTARAPLKILGLYAPRNGRTQKVRDDFWTEVAEEIEATSQAVDLVIVGDLNATPPQWSERNRYVVGRVLHRNLQNQMMNHREGQNSGWRRRGHKRRRWTTRRWWRTYARCGACASHRPGWTRLQHRSTPTADPEEDWHSLTMRCASMRGGAQC